MAEMRAAVVAAAGRIAVVEVARPEPGPGEVRIRLEGCGVCASNLTPWSGPDWMRFPTAPGDFGHEGWGTIDAVGAGVSAVRPGDRVAALSYRAYAEYDVASETAVVRLPDALAGSPFPGEPLGCAMNIFERAEIREGQTVAVVGSGFLGVLLCQLAARRGARVVAVSRRAFARDLAERAGATAVLPFDGDRAPVVDAIERLTGGRLCERVFEAAGRQDTLDLSAELTAERGRLVVAGYHQDGPRQVNMWLWNWRGIDVINAHERDPARYVSGMRAAVDAVVSGRIDPAPLLTHRYRLDELDRALDDTRDRPHGFLKAMVLFP